MDINFKETLLEIIETKFDIGYGSQWQEDRPNIMINDFHVSLPAQISDENMVLNANVEFETRLWDQEESIDYIMDMIITTNIKPHKVMHKYQDSFEIEGIIKATRLQEQRLEKYGMFYVVYWQLKNCHIKINESICGAIK